MDITWASLPNLRPNFDECKKHIVKWDIGTTRSFAGMPRPSDVDFETRLRSAYTDICSKTDAIAADHKSAVSIGIFSAMNVLATGFADLLVIDGDPFMANRSAKHIIEGFPAIVAGRYRQLRESEESKRGLSEVAKMNTWFGKDDKRPTSREIDACRDHQIELEYKRPPNPVRKTVFGGEWKSFIKARDPVIEKVTGTKGGTLCNKDPHRMAQQVEKLEKEAEGQGWSLQGPKVCRILWDILPDEMRKVLKQTKCYWALQTEDFKADNVHVPTSRYSGLVTALLENFGGAHGPHQLGTAVAAVYAQTAMETNRQTGPLQDT